MSRQKLLVLIYGVPASGKSTFLRTFLSSFPPAYVLQMDELESRHLNCSTDHLAALLHDNHVNVADALPSAKLKQEGFDLERQREARRLGKRLVEQLVQAGPVVVEDQLLTIKERRRMARYADRCLQILCKVTLEEALRNQSGRRKTSPAIVTNSWNRLQVGSPGLSLTLEERRLYAQDSWLLFQKHARKVEQSQTEQTKGQDELSIAARAQLQMRAAVGELLRTNHSLGGQASNLKQQFMGRMRQGEEPGFVVLQFKEALHDLRNISLMS